jgi:hypothetical protein
MPTPGSLAPCPASRSSLEGKEIKNHPLKQTKMGREGGREGSTRGKRWTRETRWKKGAMGYPGCPEKLQNCLAKHHPWRSQHGRDGLLE